jgi:hypothetical protein
MIIFAVLLGACKKHQITGNAASNLAPETSLTMDTIIRGGDDRLNAEVHIHWWGDDPDGFLKGFEFTFDSVLDASTSWVFTQAYDSVFLLPPPPGEDSMDFVFSVRAVDNADQRDPTPARLTFPIKNSVPAVTFLPGAQNPVFTFPALRFYWEASDIDGLETVNRFELAWNDTTGPFYATPATATSAIFEADDPGASFPQCRVFLNNDATQQPDLMQGLRLNDSNQLFIRVVDNSEAASPFVGSYKLFVRRVTSSVVLINAYTSGGAAVESFYAESLLDQGITSFDTLRIFEKVGGNLTQQSPDNLSQARVFNFFETMIWFGNSADKSLSLAQKTTVEFFNKGGRMLMAVYVSSSFDEQSQFLDFTPIESLVDPTDTTLILADTSAVSAQQPGWPALESSAFVGVVKPMNIVIGAEPLYSAELLARDDSTLNITSWTGNSSVMARRKSSGQTNFILSTLELQILDGLGNIDSLFQRIYKDEFGL